MPSDLTAAIAERTASVRDRIAAACRRAGRDPAEVRLIAVSKTFPPETVQAAIEAGLRDFGENRVQELEEKGPLFPGEQRHDKVQLHFIGSLQRNKAQGVIDWADLFHALDSERLARRLDLLAGRAGRVLPCFVQANVSGEESKSGFAPDDLHAALDRFAAFEHLRIVGLMTLAAPVQSEEELETMVRPQFRLLRDLGASYDSSRHPTISLDRLSMGMSDDFEVAVEEGATDVRVGSAIFGPRDG